MSSSPPANFLLSEIRWADQVASRLRLLMSTCADESLESRQAYIEEEIERRLEEVPPGKRALYLDELAAKFPTWQRSVGAGDTVPAAMRPVESVDEVVQLLGRIAPRWSAADQEKFRARLTELGLIKPVGVGGSGDIFTELTQRFALAQNETIVPARLAHLCLQQAEFFAILDKLVWNTWSTLAPRSVIRRDMPSSELREQVRRYLCGDAKLSDQQMTQQIERTRQLIAGLLGSLSLVSRGFVERYKKRYSPEAVTNLVKLEGGGGLLRSADSRHWRKYSELAAEITEAGIESEMQEFIVKYVEDIKRVVPRGNL